MPTLYDRLSRRLEDARDYHDDFESDVENGRRNKFGFRNKKWHEHEEELRHKRHEDRRKRYDRTHHEDKGKDKGHSPDWDHSNDRSTWDQDRPNKEERKSGRSRHLNGKDGKQAHSEHADDGDRKHHRRHHDTARGIKVIRDEVGRTKDSSKAIDNAKPRLRVRDVLFEVAGKFVEDLLGGSTKKPEEDLKHRRKHSSREDRDNDDGRGDRHHRHRSRTPERQPVKLERQQHGAPKPPRDRFQGPYTGSPGGILLQQQEPYGRPFQCSPPRHQMETPAKIKNSHYGAPPEPPQDYGEAESYYHGHPLQQQQASGGHSRAPPPPNGSRPQTSNAKPKGPFGDEEVSYRNDSEPREHSRKSRQPEAEAHNSTPPTRRKVPTENPSTSSAKDFGRHPGNGMPPPDTATSTSVDDFDQDYQGDLLSIGSRTSSLVTEQPAMIHGKQSMNAHLKGAREQHSGDAEDSEDTHSDAHSDAEEIHIRGGGGNDEDDESNAQYNEYEEFDDEYLGDEVPPMKRQGGYSSLSYADAKARRGRNSSYTYTTATSRGYSSLSYTDTKLESKGQCSSYADTKPRSGGYSSLSYAAAKVKGTVTEHTSDTYTTSISGRYGSLLYADTKLKSKGQSSSYTGVEPKNGGYSSLSYADAKAKRTGTEPTSNTRPEPRRPQDHAENSNESLHGHSGRFSSASSKPGYRHTPLGRQPRTYDMSSDDESESSTSPEPSTDKKFRNSKGQNNDHERSEKPKPSQAKPKSEKQVRYQEQSEYPLPRHKPHPKSTHPRSEEPPRPMPPPKSRRATQEKHTALAPIEESPTNHYATLEISSLASPEEFVCMFLGKSLRC